MLNRGAAAIGMGVLLVTSILASAIPIQMADALLSDGTVGSEEKIAEGVGGFSGPLANGDLFGTDVDRIGDLDNDGVEDLVVGARLDNDSADVGGFDRGAVWILFMKTDGTVKSEQKISETAGDFGGDLDDQDFFGASVAGIGDINGDGDEDIAVGAFGDDDGGSRRGAVWILFLDTDGTVKETLSNSGFQKISDTVGTPGSFSLDNNDRFGTSVAGIGDYTGGGVPDIAVGARFDDDPSGGSSANNGAVYILFMASDGTAASFKKISMLEGGFAAAGGSLSNSDFFGESVAALGDLDNDGVVDLAVGASGSNDGGTDTGEVWIVFLNPSGFLVKATQLISDTVGDFTGAIDANDRFGISVAGIGDLNGDGPEDLAVGAFWDDDGGFERGAVWILFLDIDGTVKESLSNNGFQKISDTDGNFGGVLIDDDEFGSGLADLGDLDGDGLEDIAVGEFRDDTGGADSGAVWMLLGSAVGAPVGGEILPIDMTSLMVAGAFTNTYWILLLPILGGIGVVVSIIRGRKKESNK